jgi:hypothetical protein
MMVFVRIMPMHYTVDASVFRTRGFVPMVFQQLNENKMENV